MKPNSLMAHTQKHRLAQLAELAVFTAASLAAFLRSMGQPCDKSTLYKYSQGRLVAPLALLDFLLAHADPQGRIAILSLWAEPFGLKVVQRDLSPEERWRLHLLAAELRRVSGELETVAEVAPLRRAA